MSLCKDIDPIPVVEKHKVDIIEGVQFLTWIFNLLLGRVGDDFGMPKNEETLVFQNRLWGWMLHPPGPRMLRVVVGRRPGWPPIDNDNALCMLFHLLNAA